MWKNIIWEYPKDFFYHFIDFFHFVNADFGRKYAIFWALFSAKLALCSAIAAFALAQSISKILRLRSVQVWQSLTMIVLPFTLFKEGLYELVSCQVNTIFYFSHYAKYFK